MIITKSLVDSLAQQAATSALSDHIELSQAIISAIEAVPELVEQVYTPSVQNLIKRVVTSANKLVWLSIYAKSEDKTFSFDVADADLIINTLLKKYGMSSKVTWSPIPIDESDYAIDDDFGSALDAAENSIILNDTSDWDLDDETLKVLSQLEDAGLSDDTNRLQALQQADEQPVEQDEDPLSIYPPVMHPYLTVIEGAVKPNTKEIAGLLLSMKQTKDEQNMRGVQLADLMDKTLGQITKIIQTGGDPEKLIDAIIAGTNTSISEETIKQFIAQALKTVPKETQKAASFEPDERMVRDTIKLFDSIAELTALQKTAADKDFDIARQFVDALVQEFPEIKQMVISYIGG